MLEIYNVLYSSLWFRVSLSFFTSGIIVIVLGHVFLRLFKNFFSDMQNIRAYVPNTHLKKQGVPALGGVLIFIGFIISVYIWIDDIYTNYFVLIVLWLGGCFFLIGFIDDIKKLLKQNSEGLSAKTKFLLSIVICVVFAVILEFQQPQDIRYNTYIPFFHGFYLDLKWLIFLFVPFVIVGSANSVNLTDGLDGLAATISFVVCLALLVILYLIWDNVLWHTNNYQLLEKLELAIVLASICGALLGFLWYNGIPAQIFMGDSGSLFLGSTLAAVAVVLKIEVILAIFSIIFIVETLSVIIQLVSYKTKGKLVFLMSPIHHHFEKKGYKEYDIVHVFVLINVLVILISFAFLDITNVR